ncbi:hypothetical protein UPYG_G00231350 [Umbra pygmaea]|uniref:Uncharacterized protein n=1 Tax=Umbra pygmaea TaxID=75934 RepID=A0ABD0WED5_UMBPY
MNLEAPEQGESGYFCPFIPQVTMVDKWSVDDTCHWLQTINLIDSKECFRALQRKDPGFKKKDKSHIRALLIQVLFDSITKHTWYPNHKMYGDVLGSLITCFTFLKDGSSSGYV